MSIFQTRDGRMRDLLALTPEDVDFSEIARKLARLPRFCAEPLPDWSVAAHSILVAMIAAELAPGETAIHHAALLHDAHEAFIGDITTPVQNALAILDDPRRAANGLSRIGGLLATLKGRVQIPILTAAGLDWTPTLARDRAIREADHIALFAERDALMQPPERPWALEDEIWTAEAKARFGWAVRWVRMDSRLRDIPDPPVPHTGTFLRLHETPADIERRSRFVRGIFTPANPEPAR